MLQQTRLRLSGYFDRNFGDDYMFKIVTQALCDVKFYVDAQEWEIPALSGSSNVCFAPGACSANPSVTVTGSGFMINDWKALKYELLLFLRGALPGNYCIGCNIEPFKSLFRAFLMGEKLNKYRLITCRDRKSEAWLRTHCKKPEIHYAPDILFSLPEEWLPQKKADRLLGIAMMHCPGDREDAEHYRVAAEMADFWVERTGKDVLLMAFDSGKEDDVFSCNAIRNRMAQPEKAHIIIHRDGTEILEAASRCEKMICARFHAAVLALRMGIPFYPLFYRVKMRNMLEDIGCPHSGSDLQRIDEAALRAFLAEPQKAYELPEEIFADACRHVQLLRAAIEKDGKR